MKKSVILLMSLMTLATAAVAASSADSVMAKAHAQAKADGKNVFIHIGAPW